MVLAGVEVVLVDVEVVVVVVVGGVVVEVVRVVGVVVVDVEVVAAVVVMPPVTGTKTSWTLMQNRLGSFSEKALS